jgi:hypothetical protein
MGFILIPRVIKYYFLNPSKPKERESGRIVEEQNGRENIWVGGARGALYLGGGRKSILLEGTQAIPARPSDKERMGVKTLGWWVVKA